MTRTLSFQLRSLDETRSFARTLAALATPGDVVLLSGDLGAGKTTLVRALAEALGVDPRVVSSPTFTVMNAYDGAHIDPIVHMDAYRLEGEDEGELLELGWDDATRGASLTLVEWGERIERVLVGLVEDEPARITLSHLGETSRGAAVTLPESWASRAGFAGLAALAEGTDGDDTSRPGFPFSSEREQLADLYHWFGEAYRISRPIQATDDDDA